APISPLESALGHPAKLARRGGDVHSACPELRREEPHSATRGLLLTPLESAVAKLTSRKSFTIRTYEKNWGGSAVSQARPAPNSSCSRLARMIRRIAPQFFTMDIPGTLAYYRDKLGFQCLSTWMDPPVYAIVARDEQAIHFRCAEPPTANPDKYAD